MSVMGLLSDVVARLIRQGYPESVAERIASGELPMDTASRMERARQQGFDTENVAFHGTEADIREFIPSERGKMGPGIYTSPDPRYASRFAVPLRDMEMARTISNREALDDSLVEYQGANILPLLLRGNRMERFEAMSQNPDIPMLSLADPPATGQNRLAESLREQGVTGLDMRAAGSDGMRGSVTEQNTFDPDNVRSLYSAAFDPEYSGPNILGATATTAGALGLLAAPEEAEAGVMSKAFGRAFDQRFDPRKKEQDRLANARFEIDERPGQDAPVISLSELEGRPFITSMSDRTQAGGLLTKIGDTELDRPVNLQGGQGFMFENPGMVWASAQGPVNQIAQAARAAGDDPLFLPFRMAPTGGDFATMTGETMLSFAASNMNKKQKRALDRAIKNYKSTGSMVQGRRVNEGLQIEGWKGVDDPSAPAVWRSTPDALRKELMNMMDVRFRDEGGLSIGEARLAVTDPRQANAADAQVQNVGRIFTDRDIIERSGHFSYPRGVPGEGIGRIDQPVGIFELMPEARVGGAQRTVADPANPTAQEIRALQMKPYTGRITEDTLKRLQERGVEVGSANPQLLGAMGLGTAGILGAVAAGDRDDTAMAVAPRSDTLQDITMGLRDVERRLEGSPASLLFPEGVVNYLETVNRPYEDPTALTRAMALLDFL